MQCLYLTVSDWVIGYKLVEGVRDPDKVGTGDIRYSMSFSVTEDGLTYLSSSMSFPKWDSRGELVLSRAFDISRDEVVTRIYEWHQSQK